MPDVLTLIVPGCCGPLPRQSANPMGLHADVQQLLLWKRLSCADRSIAADDFYRQLAVIFDYKNSGGSLPYAALNLLGEGGSPESVFWLHADPVCMQADIDHAILFDAHSLQLSSHEADGLIAELNIHFSQDGIMLQHSSAASWYIQSGSHRNIATTALHDVAGRNVNRFMPTGEDAQYWKRFMNEAQMLLHTSGINREREARGQLPVNSLWLWGEGRLPEVSGMQPGFDRVLTNNACVRGLAKLKNIDCKPLPENINRLTNLFSASDRVCVVLDNLFSAVNYGDVALWQEELLALYKNWLQPLITGALKNKMTVDLYPCNGSVYTLRANQSLRFWRHVDIKRHLRLDA